MALLICAATGKELSALAPDLLPQPKAIPEMQLLAGKLKHGDALFMATGVGPVNAALALGLALGLTHPSIQADARITGVLMAGLAGAFNLETHPLRSIWQINEEIWPEYGLNDGIAVTARAFRHPLWEKNAENPVFERIPVGEPGALPGALPRKGLDWPCCASLTVAGVTASFARRQALWDTWHAPLENMEGFAAAYAAARAELPMAEIRVVSNKTGPRGRDEKDFEGALDAMGGILPALNLN